MSYVRTMIHAIESQPEEYGINLPSKIIRKLKIPLTSLTIAFGSHQAQGTIMKGEKSRETEITVPLLRLLRLPTGAPIHLSYYAAENKLVFGPYMGIMLARVNTVQSSPFANFTTFVEELADVCRNKGGVVSVFTPNDIHWESKTIRGMIRRKGVWRPYTLPLPQCIYNRLPSRQHEQKENVGASIQRFKEMQIPFFNEQFINKWQVHEALANHPEIGHYLPKTVRLTSSHDLINMLGEHKMVYVKPISGSMGRGIFRIYHSANGYQLQYATMNGSVTKTLKDIPSLYQTLRKRIKGKNYLVQQGLLLIGLNRKPADFRALVQKNGKGEWAVSSLVARIGQNRIVSNVARGGTMAKASQALQSFGPWTASVRPTPNSLNAAALEIARELEKSLSGHYAEMGIDLGVDVSGRIWLLEVNSKPSKADNTIQRVESEEVKSVRKVRPSVRRLYEYSTFLAGFPPLSIPKPVKAKKVKKKRSLGQRR